MSHTEEGKGTFLPITGHYELLLLRSEGMGQSAKTWEQLHSNEPTTDLDRRATVILLWSLILEAPILSSLLMHLVRWMNGD